MRALACVPAMLVLAGCGAWQKADLHVATVEDPAAQSVRWHDSLGVVTGELCFLIRDGAPDYNALFYGPLGAPTFPLGILDPLTRDRPLFHIELQLQPRQPGISFHPRELTLVFPDGATTTPLAFRFFSSEMRGEEVVLEGQMNFRIAFDKPAQESSPNALRMSGFYKDGQPVALPVVHLRREMKFGFVPPAHTAGGAWVGEPVKSACWTVWDAKK